MRQTPIWSVSAWGGFVCALLAFSLLLNGAEEASAVMLGGALTLIFWAAWLAHRRH